MRCAICNASGSGPGSSPCTRHGEDPLSGQLVDACKALASNGGKPQGEQTANADSSRCGQAFNGVIWAGFSSPRFGTFMIGRQQSLQLDALALYDPQALSILVPRLLRLQHPGSALG
ncbi:MAG: hypothetical protein M3N97_11985 [Pseudomonadota bacterium]|nr:hypothetical protein [Pseudomonadota bacterium]